MHLHEKLFAPSTHVAPLAHVWLAQSSTSLERGNNRELEVYLLSLFPSIKVVKLDSDSQHSPLLALTCLIVISN